MFDKRCAICGDMVGPYGDGKWLHVANQYPDPPHEVVLDGHMQRCGAAQGGMFCICDSLRDEREAAERRLAHITELLNRQKITHAELIGPKHPVLIEVSRVEAAMKEDFDD